MSDGRPRVLTLPAGEPILHYGASCGPQLLVLQPLFEESNRCRGFVACLCRGLAMRGIGCWLPDLPGEGESARSLDAVGWDDWTGVVDDALSLIAGETDGDMIATVAIRGGALLDARSARRWRLSPVGGVSLLADLRRAGLLASGAYCLSDTLAVPLASAEPVATARVLRLDGDERACDRRVGGMALWRRPEPGDDPTLATVLVDDIETWLRG